MGTEIQVDRSYYAQPKYATVERFISYQYQIAAIRDSGVRSILLIGCGDGLVPFYLKEVLGLSVTTCDIDPELSPDIIGDVRALPLEDESYDAVAVFEVLEHMPYEEFPKALSEIARVSKGPVFVSLPYRNVSFEMLIKFPYIRTILDRQWLRLLIKKPITFPGFAVSKQHYWEIDTVTTKKRVEKVIGTYFSIKKRDHVILDPYRYFLRLEKRKALTNTYAKEYYESFLQNLPTDYKSARWFATPAAKLDFDQTRAVILRALNGKRVESLLEIGPGDGVWTDLFVPKTDSLTLLDQSSEMIARAKDRLKTFEHITYVNQDFLTYAPGRQFDMVCGIRCFEYFDDKKLGMEQCASLIRPGGYVVLVTKNPDHIRTKKAQEKNLHRGQISKKEMHTLFREHGFVPVETLSATLRIKAHNPVMRGLSRFLHALHAKSGGVLSIPFLTHLFTESYIYVARRQ